LLDRVFAGAEVVFHEAAIPSVPRSLAAPLASHNANATGTLNVLEAARRCQVRRVVYAGSSSAYGEPPSLPVVETMAPAPLSPYAVSKLAGEQYCRVYARVFGVQTVILRYFNVFGPRQDPNSQYAAVIPRFITSALAGLSPTVYGDGEQSRDFCFIDNVVEANLRAADAEGASGKVFNIACGSGTSLNRILALLGESLGRPVAAHYEPARPGDVRHSLADISQAKAVLGYTAPVDFLTGLARTLAWFGQQRSTP
jgi:UDP-glucose 4-epimerase